MQIPSCNFWYLLQCYRLQKLPGFPQPQCRRTSAAQDAARAALARRFSKPSRLARPPVFQNQAPTFNQAAARFFFILNFHENQLASRKGETTPDSFPTRLLLRSVAELYHADALLHNKNCDGMKSPGSALNTQPMLQIMWQERLPHLRNYR